MWAKKTFQDTGYPVMIVKTVHVSVIVKICPTLSTTSKSDDVFVKGKIENPH